jgi:putative transposase
MPRRGRAIVGDLPYHIINRAAGRVALFSSPGDYDAFEDLVALALARLPLRVLAYSVMPNHWHFVVWPRQEDGSDVSRFFHWLTMSHTQRHHAARRTVGTGPLYQGRFKCFPIERDEHLVTVLRYVERNPLRAGLVPKASSWRWSSLWHWAHGDTGVGRLLSPWPVERPDNWLTLVEEPQTAAEEAALRRSVTRGQPFGGSMWREDVIKRAGLRHTVRSRGRPRKVQQIEDAPGTVTQQ